MKKSLAVGLIVLLLTLLVVGVAFAERKVCGTCRGTGAVCQYCGASMSSGSVGTTRAHCGNSYAAITCYICDGRRYVEVDVCE